MQAVKYTQNPKHYDSIEYPLWLQNNGTKTDRKPLLTEIKQNFSTYAHHQRQVAATGLVPFSS